MPHSTREPDTAVVRVEKMAAGGDGMRRDLDAPAHDNGHERGGLIAGHCGPPPGACRDTLGGVIPAGGGQAG